MIAKILSISFAIMVTIFMFYLMSFHTMFFAVTMISIAVFLTFIVLLMLFNEIITEITISIDHKRHKRRMERIRRSHEKKTND
jgi:hypothetical protein